MIILATVFSSRLATYQVRLGSYPNPQVEIPDFGRDEIGAGWSSTEGGLP
jgi:hypothetical protein